MKARLIPAILVKNKKEFEERLKFYRKFFNYFQLDALDNTLVKNKSWFDLSKVKGDFNIEIHAMVARPEKYFKIWLKDRRVKRVIVHIEAFAKKKSNFCDIIRQVKKAGKQLGIAVNPSTIFKIEDDVFNDVDAVLVMGVEPGWSGQKFHNSAFSRIERLRKISPKLNIMVDGGINEKNLKKVYNSGANEIAASTMFIKLAANPEKIIDLKKKFVSWQKKR